MVFDIDGVIATLSFTFEGRFTIHFDRDYVEKKKRGETFFNDKWFKVALLARRSAPERNKIARRFQEEMNKIARSSGGERNEITRRFRRKGMSIVMEWTSTIRCYGNKDPYFVFWLSFD